MTEQDYYRPFDQPVAPWGPPPPLEPPKKKHTKGWAIAWSIVSAVLFLAATFWFLAFAVNYSSTHCVNDSDGYHVCVNQSTGQDTVTSLDGS